MVPVEILNTTGSGLQLLSALTLPQNLLSCFGGAVLILFQNHFGVHDDPVLQTCRWRGRIRWWACPSFTKGRSSYISLLASPRWFFFAWYLPSVLTFCWKKIKLYSILSELRSRFLFGQVRVPGPASNVKVAIRIFSSNFHLRLIPNNLKCR